MPSRAQRVIRSCDAGRPPVRLASGARCQACPRVRELVAVCRERGAVPCAHGCGTLVAAETVVAAHVVDGRPESGWMASCASCNQAAKGTARGGGRPQGARAGGTPAPWQSGVRPGLRVFRAADRDRADVRPRAPRGAHAAP